MNPGSFVYQNWTSTPFKPLHKAAWTSNQFSQNWVKPRPKSGKFKLRTLMNPGSSKVHLPKSNYELPRRNLKNPELFFSSSIWVLRNPCSLEVWQYKTIGNGLPTYSKTWHTLDTPISTPQLLVMYKARSSLKKVSVTMFLSRTRKIIFAQDIQKKEVEDERALRWCSVLHDPYLMAFWSK